VSSMVAARRVVVGCTVLAGRRIRVVAVGRTAVAAVAGTTTVRVVVAAMAVAVVVDTTGN
jgi:hypothetical protein